MLKRIVFPIALLFCLFSLNAQKKSDIKLGIEPGFLVLSDSENLGLFLNVEPKLKVSKNTFIGLRIGVVLNPQKFENYDRLQFYIDEKSDNGGVSFVPTFDYYLNKDDIRPYLGVGVGAYLLSSYIDVSQKVIGSPSDNLFEVRVNYQIGLLLRGGFESGKSRLGLEYNFVQKADLEIPNGQIIGTVDNSYFGLSIGFMIGGG